MQINFIKKTAFIISCLFNTSAFAQNTGNYYSPVAEAVCEKDFYKSQCVLETRNIYFDPKIQSICLKEFFSKDCLLKNKNKVFDSTEVDACRNEFFAADCLSKFGSPTTLRAQSRPSSPIIIIERDYTLDALDQLLAELIRQSFQKNSHANEEYCYVTNSNDNHLGTVAKSDFMSVARQFADDNNSCAVTSVKNERGSRTLLDANGNTVANNLTKSESDTLKKRMGYKSCRVLQCEVTTNSGSTSGFDNFNIQ